MISEGVEYGPLPEALRAAMVHAAGTNRPDVGQTQAALVRLHQRIAGTGIRTTPRAARRGSGPNPAKPWVRAAAGGLVAVIAAGAVVLVVLRTGRVGEDAPRPGSVSSSVSEPSASPQPTVSGDPVPASLRGTWSGPTHTVGGFKVTEKLTLTLDKYGLCVVGNGCLNGDVVARGTTLIFFNEGICGLPAGAASAGRYTWTISGGRLTLHPLAVDPCDRGSDLAQNAYWTR